MSEHKPLPSPEQVMQRILDDVSHDEDGCTYGSSALDPIKEMQREILDLREAVRVLAHGYVQCRGALIIDHMLQPNGLMYGTTNCALEYGSVVNANPIAAAAVEAARKGGER